MRYLPIFLLLLYIGWRTDLQASLVFKQGSASIVQIDENGNYTFSKEYAEMSNDPVIAGELRFSYSGNNAQWSSVDGSDRKMNFKGRFSPNAIIPDSGLIFKNTSQQAVASLSATGDFYTQGNVTNPLEDPTLPGPFTFSSVVYGSAGSQYIDMYKTPTAGYTTPRRNISAFYNSVDPTWTFDGSSVPLNGMLRIPNGTGPFPLVVFVHGNHNAFEYSEPGYIYLCELLASHGIIAATIDENFLNGWTSNENDARAIVDLEHVKQFGIWNIQSGHPLYGKVDMSKIMIVGHSRGGEAVAVASYFNDLNSIQPDQYSPTVPLDGTQGLGPYNFSLQCIFAFGPVDGQYIPIGGMVPVRNNYFVTQGASANDVTMFMGYATYNRANPIDLTDPTDPANGFKAHLFIYGANHNYFNTVWGAVWGSTATITAEEQQTIGKIYVVSLAKALLQGKTRYLDIVKSYQNALSWLPPLSETLYVSQYQDKQRIFFNHYEEDTNLVTVSPPATGSNAQINLLNSTEESMYYYSNDPPVNHALNLRWNSLSGNYRTTFQTTLQCGNFPYLALHACTGNEDLNIDSTIQNLSVQIKDDSGNSASVLLSDYAPLNYPNQKTYEYIMQTFRIPLLTLAKQGVNTSRIKEINLLTNQFGSGSIYVDEMQLTY